MTIFRSNDMVHNHYLEEAKKRTQERSRNSKPSLMPSARSQSTANEVNSHAKVPSNKTTNKNKPVEQKGGPHKQERQIPTGHRFSIQKTSVVQKKTMTPRSCLRWKPTGKIFKTVGLRWVPTGKIFASSTTKVDSEPLNGSNADITNQYECEQNLDVSAGTLNVSAVPVGCPSVAEGAPETNEDAQAIPAPIQEPQPPPIAAQGRTMVHRLGRLEEDVYGLRGALGEQREVLDSMARDFSRFTTWTVTSLSLMMDHAGVRKDFILALSDQHPTYHETPSDRKMEEINNFQQEPNETLYQAWERFKELLMKYTQYYLMEMQGVILFYNGLEVLTRQILDSKGAIPTKTVVDVKVAIQEMAEYSQKWHNGTFRTKSTENSDGLASIQAQLNNLGREIKKVNEKAYVAQVGCELYKGPHYTKDCPLKEEGKPLKEAYYTQFGVPFQQGGQYRAAASGFYQRNNANPLYQERRQSMKESPSKFMNELKKRHEESLSRFVKA
nr:hypothetical protein [Tanacetum cinerariifolium]